MEVKIQELHEKIKELFPDAVSVKIFVNSQGIDVDPSFKANPNGYAMQTIAGRWLKRKV